MGEARRKKERRPPPKPTEKLPLLVPSTDKAVSTKQRNFCKNLVKQLLNDESSLSFSQPVNELWEMDQLTGYFERIKEPMDLGTVKTHLEDPDHFIHSPTGLFDPNALRKDVRLVFLNCLDFNAKGTDLYRLATKFLHFFDKELADMPGQPAPGDEGDTGPTHSPSAEKDKDKSDHPAKDVIDEHPAKSTSPEKKDDNLGDDASEKGDEHHPQQEPEPEMKEDDSLDNHNDDHHSKDGPHQIDDELDHLHREIQTLQKQRNNAVASLAELELMRNVPLTHEENIRLRDQVEKLPWDSCRRVVKILQTYVDEALMDCNEEDPEFVTLEFSTIEPRFLRDIEELIRPNPEVEKEKTLIISLDAEIGALQKKVKRKELDREQDQATKKKPRRRR